MRKLSLQNIFKLFLVFLITINSGPMPGIRAGVIMQQPLVSAVETCRQETGATGADLEALLKKTKPSSMTVKCMRACLMKQFSLMDENGKFNREVALDIVGHFVGTDDEKMRIATEIVDACYTMAVSENHCEAAEQYGKCANRQVKARRVRRQKISEFNDSKETFDIFFNEIETLKTYFYINNR